MPSCEVCGEEDYDCHDGLYYCSHCRTQSQQIHELEQAEDFLEGAFQRGLSIKTPKKTQSRDDADIKVKQIAKGRPWTTDEGFQLILRDQVKSLIKMGADPRLKDVVFKFWTLYLSKLEIAFTKQERSKALFTKLCPYTRDIYVPTTKKPYVPIVRTIKTRTKRGNMYKKGKDIDKMVLQATLGSEEFYDGDNPIENEEEEEEEADELIAICDDYFEKRKISLSESDASDILSDSYSDDDIDEGEKGDQSLGSNASVRDINEVLPHNESFSQGSGREGVNPRHKDATISKGDRVEGASDISRLSGDTTQEPVEVDPVVKRKHSADLFPNSGGAKSMRKSGAVSKSKDVIEPSSCGTAPRSQSDICESRNDGRKSKGADSTCMIRNTGDSEGNAEEVPQDVDNIIDEDDDGNTDVQNADADDAVGVRVSDDECLDNDVNMHLKRAKKVMIPSTSQDIRDTTWRLHMVSTLSFCYIGLAFTNGNVVISDILRWVRNGSLPYHNIHEIFPDDMRFGPTDSKTFCELMCGGVPPHLKVSRTVAGISRLLDIELPRVGLEKLIGRYIIQLDLPGQFSALAMQLLKNSPVREDAFVEGMFGIFPYEAMAMAYIVVSIKMVFGLDDITEKELSTYSRKMKDVLENSGISDASSYENLFIWEDWVMSGEQRISRHRSQQMPSTFEDIKGIQDLDECLDAYNISNRAKHGRFSSDKAKDPELTGALRKPLLTIIDELNEMKVSADEEESSEDEDPLAVLFRTPKKSDPQKHSDSTQSQAKARKSFFSCTLRHLTNTETFVSDMRTSRNQSAGSPHQSKRRRLQVDEDCDNGLSIVTENALDDLIEGRSLAHKRYILYQPGKITSDNRHISYIWLLSLCGLFTECSSQDIDNCINRIQYSLPQSISNKMRRLFKVTECPQGLVPNS